eukprot:422725-Rhodomonas_salina.1
MPFSVQSVRVQQRLRNCFRVPMTAHGTDNVLRGTARSLGWFSPGSPSPGHTRITGPLPGPDSNLKPGHNANRDPHATAKAPADQHHVTHEGEATTARDVQVEAAGQPAGGPEGAGE